LIWLVYYDSLLPAGFQIHIYYATYNDNSQHNEAACTFAFILAHEPDKEGHQRQYKNGKENNGWDTHYY
jgi:hypothetical protein